MKKLILTSGLAAMVAASSFGQGILSVKTTQGKNAVEYSTDGSTAALAYIGTDGTAGSLGAVHFEYYENTSGTALSLGTTAATGNLQVPIFTGWTALAADPTAGYGAGGVVSSYNVQLTFGTAGSPLQLEVVAYTGTLAAPTMYGYAGELFNGSGTIQPNGTVTVSTSTGALGWSQTTGGGSPPPATAILAGSTGLGSLVLLPVSTPEPTTMVLGGLGVATLLAFRRRK